MTFLPIVQRELKVAARRRSTYWLRLLVAFLAMILAGVIGIFSYSNNLSAVRPSLGKDIFGGLALLALVYALLSGRRSTADCLSEEKREGTLGLLFLTDLKGYDVVLGKLAATSLNGLYGLLAVFPVMAIPLLMGGVTQGELWRMVLVLIDTILFALAVGLFVSALSRDPHRAMGANSLMLLLLIAGAPAVAGALFFSLPSSPVIHELLYPCPAYTWYMSFDGAYRPAPHRFWTSLGLIHGMTWLLMILASWIAPWSWQDRAPAPGRAPWLSRFREWSLGSGEKRGCFRRELLNINAFYWLASRSRLKPVQVWCVMGFITLWWIGERLFADVSLVEEPVSLLAAILFNTTLKIWIALEASQRLAEDQKSGALELLLSTPLTVRDILAGQFLALRRQFFKPLSLVILLELVFVFSPRQHVVVNEPAIPAIWFGGVCILIADVAALPWVAMESALTARSPNHATILTLWRVLLLPWVLYALIAIVTGLWMEVGRSSNPDWKFYLYLWFWLGIGADLLYGLRAWIRLHNGFRELALLRLTAAKSRQPN
jgi:ABC-type transport system involved in multi-copper enzyme maturation permease subunit